MSPTELTSPGIIPLLAVQNIKKTITFTGLFKVNNSLGPSDEMIGDTLEVQEPEDQIPREDSSSGSNQMTMRKLQATITLLITQLSKNSNHKKVNS
jgi:hypothetical protein